MVGPLVAFVVLSGLLHCAKGNGFVLWAKRGDSTSCGLGSCVTGIYCSNGLPFYVFRITFILTCIATRLMIEFLIGN